MIKSIINRLKTDKKLKGIVMTVLEMLLVTGILFGILMYAESKINSEADKTSGISDIEKEETTKPKILKVYDVVINKTNNFITIYETAQGNRNAIRSYKATIGKDLKPGSYKMTDVKHMWIRKGNWYRYAIKFSNKWIYSCTYTDKYPYYLDVSDYSKLGSVMEGENISVNAQAAQFLYSHMYEGFKITVVKGKKGDIAPQMQENPALLTGLCWDPTDPDKDSPYLKKQNGKIVFGSPVVVVERKHDIDYLANVVALDPKGGLINNQLKWKKISTKKSGKYKVKYYTKSKASIKLQGTQTVIVQDTLSPSIEVVLPVNKKNKPKKFVYKVKSGKRVDMANEKNVDDIKEMIKKQLRISEKKCKIRIYFPKAREIRIGTMYAQVRVQDRDGNESNITVPVKIAIKKPKKDKKKELEKKKKLEEKKRKLKEKKKLEEKRRQEEKRKRLLEKKRREKEKKRKLKEKKKRLKEKKKREKEKAKKKQLEEKTTQELD